MKIFVSFKCEFKGITQFCSHVFSFNALPASMVEVEVMAGELGRIYNVTEVVPLAWDVLPERETFLSVTGPYVYMVAFTYIKGLETGSEFVKLTRKVLLNSLDTLRNAEEFLRRQYGYTSLRAISIKPMFKDALDIGSNFFDTQDEAA